MLSLSSLRAARPSRVRSLSLILLTLSIGAIFKVAAFWRETYIASRFGVSADTDIYFGLQQIPMALVTFMLGAFGLAFTPAYAQARRTQEGPYWVAGTVILATVLGLAGSAVTLAAEPFLLHCIHAQDSPTAHLALLLLSLSYAPILITGLWICINNAAGRTLLSQIIIGLPYLLMTITLIALCFWPRVLPFSLPASWLAGFFLTAIASVCVLIKMEPFSLALSSVPHLFRLSSFRRFLGQLGSSLLENAGFITNQFLIVFFFGLAGSGAISANNYAMRIGMLGYGILTIPLAQLAQSRLCNAQSAHVRLQRFVRELIIMAVLVGVAAGTLFFFREDVARLVYLRGRFSIAELQFVVILLPAWLSYYVVLSLNTVTSRMLFARHEGMRYTRTMLCAYGVSNLLRLLTTGHSAPAFIIWSEVIAVGLAFLWNLRHCLDRQEQEHPAKLHPAAAPVAA
jgi:putative peptidoglycan lipid II flippase